MTTGVSSLELGGKPAALTQVLLGFRLPSSELRVDEGGLIGDAWHVKRVCVTGVIGGEGGGEGGVYLAVEPTASPLAKGAENTVTGQKVPVGCESDASQLASKECGAGESSYEGGVDVETEARIGRDQAGGAMEEGSGVRLPPLGEGR